MKSQTTDLNSPDLSNISSLQPLVEERDDLIKQLSKTNEKLKQSEALKAQFLSNIRNELNNPLSSVLGLTNELKNNPNNVSKFSEMIHEEVSSLHFQLQNIIISAEIEGGNLEPQFLLTEVQRTINNIVNEFKILGFKKDITIEIINNLSPNLTFVIDPEILGIIIINILHNALKFSELKSIVRIEMNDNDNEIIIKIIDEGCGIKEDELQTIFNRFKQLDSGVTKGYLGHGLGLSVTSALAEKINCNINVSSKYGTGSTFELTFNKNEIIENLHNNMVVDESFMISDEIF